jgi:hypothetical protein
MNASRTYDSFAFAAGRGSCLGEAPRDSLELQPQN